MPTIQEYTPIPFEFFKNPQQTGGTPNMVSTSLNTHEGLWTSGSPLNISPNEDGTFTIKGVLQRPVLDPCCPLDTTAPLLIQFVDVGAESSTTIATEGSTTGFVVTRTSTTKVSFSYTWNPGVTEVEQGDYFRIAYQTNCSATPDYARIGYVLLETIGFPTTEVSPGCVTIFDLCNLENTCDWSCDTVYLLGNSDVVTGENDGLFFLGSFDSLGYFIPSEANNPYGISSMVNIADSTVTVKSNPVDGLGCAFSENYLLSINGKLYKTDAGCPTCDSFGPELTVALSALDAGTAWDGSSVVTGTSTQDAGYTDTNLDFVITSSYKLNPGTSTIEVEMANGTAIPAGLTVRAKAATSSTSGDDFLETIAIEAESTSATDTGAIALLATFNAFGKSLTVPLTITVSAP